mmetsp:Transcript_50577/g.120254  ORF Transcript_50577/g.120254 Transcript_50577/m.120254 type:complete len:231 (-) Transcript_50577:381-1073(-)
MPSPSVTASDVRASEIATDALYPVSDTRRLPGSWGAASLFKDKSPQRLMMEPGPATYVGGCPRPSVTSKEPLSTMYKGLPSLRSSSCPRSTRHLPAHLLIWKASSLLQPASKDIFPSALATTLASLSFRSSGVTDRCCNASSSCALRRSRWKPATANIAVVGVICGAFSASKTASSSSRCFASKKSVSSSNDSSRRSASGPTSCNCIRRELDSRASDNRWIDPRVPGRWR